MLDVYAQSGLLRVPDRADGRWARGLPPAAEAAGHKGYPSSRRAHTVGTEIGLDDWAIPLEKYTWRNVPKAMMAEPFPDGRQAQWATCDVDEVADKMRWCYENQDDARALGLKAAQWLRDHQTWDHAARALIDLLDGRYAEPESEA
jgi:glycosyltransferase involved in cell wall biosynthesis